ncbi:T9SS type A sorting domain-containing protein [bacterium]|nr:MAG: T9SS type A sorting domain-containing protein [bacterium]
MRKNVLLLLFFFTNAPLICAQSEIDTSAYLSSLNVWEDSTGAGFVSFVKHTFHHIGEWQTPEFEAKTWILKNDEVVLFSGQGLLEVNQFGYKNRFFLGIVNDNAGLTDPGAGFCGVSSPTIFYQNEEHDFEDILVDIQPREYGERLSSGFYSNDGLNYLTIPGLGSFWLPDSSIEQAMSPDDLYLFIDYLSESSRLSDSTYIKQQILFFNETADNTKFLLFDSEKGLIYWADKVGNPISNSIEISSQYQLISEFSSDNEVLYYKNPYTKGLYSVNLTSGENIQLSATASYFSVNTSLNEVYWTSSDTLFIGTEYGISVSQFLKMDSTIEGLKYVNNELFVLTKKNLFRVTNSESHSVFAVSTSVENVQIPDSYFISVENIPNPFNPSTNLNINLPESQTIDLFVVDYLGRRVSQIYNGNIDKGEHTFLFNGNRLASGLYIAILVTKKTILTHKMILIK